MIELADFSKIYGRGKNNTVAVQHVTFTAEKGKVTALIGPNGAGKTTILNAVCAQHFASSGYVYISGNDFVRHDASKESELVKTLAGFVTERNVLPEELSVAEFLDECASVRGLSGKEKTDAVKKAVKHCSIENVYSKKIKTLSKGYCQRISFAQALIGDPPNLVLDEPVSGLDPAQIAQMRLLIKELAHDKAVLLSTHFMQEVSAICDDIIILSSGRIVAHGSEREILAEEKTDTIEEAFVRLTGKKKNA